MHSALLLVVYSIVCVVASLAGGWVPLVMRLTHRGMQVAISFVSGIVLGIGLLHLLPHSATALGSIDHTLLWVLAGFLFMFFLERFFHFHHHDAPEEGSVLEELPATSPRHGGGDEEHHHAHQARTPQISAAFPWIGVAIGLTLHALIDGVAIGAAVKAESFDHAAVLAGVGTCLAVALHKPFDSLTIGTLMAAAGHSPRSRHWLNGAYAAVTPLGMVGFYALSGAISDPASGLGQALGFAAGSFLCIAMSDLLPELQFHRHDRIKLSAALAAGLALAWSTGFLEHGGHDHPTENSSHAHEHSGEQDHR
jgi:zinc and cadmium transporter